MIWFLLLVFSLGVGLVGQGWWFFILIAVSCFLDVAWGRPMRERERIEKEINDSWR
ncbi:hypothetical protein [Castellaniella sp.]|uniref:hypothetical protein n=1 Tax=Castellaniella sp. TaxID=1955812 RepID=UPI002AFEA3B3|nr:hypothetical protein [Castellaniella sp.]